MCGQWAVDHWTELCKLPICHTGWIWALAASPANPQLLASASSDFYVRVWDIFACVQDTDESGSSCQLLVLCGHAGGVQCVTYSSDGAKIVSGAQDNTVRVWDSRIIYLGYCCVHCWVTLAWSLISLERVSRLQITRR